ncbi:MAG: CoA-binding protein [Syntrophorhabdaceae bacterium]|nr:CoA-binding protein [Syntrophorhabdaceae bacterium]
MEERDNDQKKLLETARVIAIIGLSPDTGKASNVVGSYLIAHGYRVIPVNPGYTEILGQRSYPSLSDVPDRIDIVNIFRKADEVLPIVREAVGLAPKAIWLQLGILNDKARKIAENSGIPFYMDLCIKQEHARLIGK